MEEKDFFHEKDEPKPAVLHCPFCRQSASYDIRWRRRTKKNSLPPHASDEDRLRFAVVNPNLALQGGVLRSHPCKV